MREDVRFLYEVQKLDKEVIALKEQIRLYLPQLKQLETRHERKRKELAEFEDKEIQLKKKHHQCELDIKENEENISKCLAKQSQVKTNQEFHALNKEIANYQKAISKIEDQILEIISEQEKVRVEIAKEKKEFQEEEEEIKEERERIGRRIAEKKERLNEIKLERPNLVNKVTPELMKFYERIGKKYPANVVVFVKNKSCQGCFVQLLPQELIEVHKETNIVYCRSCRRILAEDIDAKNKNSESEK